jgi:chromosome segregation ATPase
MANTTVQHLREHVKELTEANERLTVHLKQAQGERDHLQTRRQAQEHLIQFLTRDRERLTAVVEDLARRLASPTTETGERSWSYEFDNKATDPRVRH